MEIQIYNWRELMYTSMKLQVFILHINEVVFIPSTTKLSPTPHICPTYFHNQNITDCSDQKWKGPSSLHR
jgi:hypothetical protein